MTAPIIRRPAVWGALCAWVLLGGAGVQTVQAQKFGRIQETNTNTAYFYYAQPGQATVQIYVWGAAQAGIYEIPDGTSLARLLTMTGGVSRGTRQEGKEPLRINVRLYRPKQSREDPLLETRAQDVLQGNVEMQQLQENDIVVVETIQPDPFTWRDALSILTTATSITLLVLRLLRFRN
jgi:hypothetical protein